MRGYFQIWMTWHIRQMLQPCVVVGPGLQLVGRVLVGHARMVGRTRDGRLGC